MPADPNIYAQAAQNDLDRRNAELRQKEQQGLERERSTRAAENAFKLQSDAQANLAKAEGENRKALADAAKTEIETQAKRSERGLHLLRMAQATGSPGAYRSARSMLAMDEEDLAAFPEQMPDAATLGKMIETGTSLKDVFQMHRDALTDLSEGKWLTGISRGLLTADSPEDRKGFMDYAAQQGAPPELLEMLSTKSPEELQAATMTPNEQADNATAAGTAETGRGNLAVAQGNLALREKELNKPPSVAAGAGFTLAPGATRYGPDGSVVATAPDRPAAAKAPTGAQNKVLGFFNRAKQADEDLQGLEPGIAEMGLLGQERMTHAPNWMQTQQGQAYNQAQRAFTEARLRKDSGAAIPVEEFASDKQTYFAQPGDSKETLTQKARARAAVLASLAFEAGGALEGFYGDDAGSMVDGYKTRAKKPQAGDAKAAPAGPKVGDRVTYQGKPYIVKGIANGQAQLEAAP